MALSLMDQYKESSQCSFDAMFDNLPVLPPESNESLLALLRDAWPSPIKSVAGSSYDKWGSSKQFGSRDDVDFQESGLDTTFSMDFDGMADFQGINTVDSTPTMTIGHDAMN